MIYKGAYTALFFIFMAIFIDIIQPQEYTTKTYCGFFLQSPAQNDVDHCSCKTHSSQNNDVWIGTNCTYKTPVSFTYESGLNNIYFTDSDNDFFVSMNFLYNILYRPDINNLDLNYPFDKPS